MTPTTLDKLLKLDRQIIRLKIENELMVAALKLNSPRAISFVRDFVSSSEKKSGDK